jgi:hypothetical protein
MKAPLYECTKFNTKSLKYNNYEMVATLMTVPLLVTANAVPSELILVTLMMEGYMPPKCLFLQEPHGVTSWKTAFFIFSIHVVCQLFLRTQ